MKNKIVTSLTGVVLAGALIIGQITPGVFADEGTTSLAISEKRRTRKRLKKLKRRPR